jgi:hypothetical protein
MVTDGPKSRRQVLSYQKGFVSLIFLSWWPRLSAGVRMYTYLQHTPQRHFFGMHRGLPMQYKTERIGHRIPATSLQCLLSASNAYIIP